MILKSTPGFWSTTIESRHLQTQPPTIQYLQTDRGDLYWAEQRPAEAGRTTILTLRDNNPTEIIPRSMNVGSKIHGGYGGAPFCVHNHILYFVGKADQRIYQSDSPHTATALTASGPRFGGLVFDAARNRLIAVCEIDQPDGQQNKLVAISLLSGAITDLYASDFVGEAVISPDGNKVAFLTWELAHMPWTQSSVVSAEFDSAGDLFNVQRVPSPNCFSHAQPIWSADSKLYYSSDKSGYWNIYEAETARSIHPTNAESSLPLWNLGVSQYAFRSDTKLLVSYQNRGVSELWEVDISSGTAQRINSSFSSISQLRSTTKGVVAIGANYQSTPVLFTIERGQIVERYKVPHQIKADVISKPAEVSLTARDGSPIYGWYYPPKNDRIKTSSPPPLVMMVHGGPTGVAVPELALRKLYFTARGFAVFDINYRGSSGFGRAYRERLNGKWLEADVEDCIDAAVQLAERGLCSNSGRFIRGSSAAGTTAILALASGSIFTGAAIYYPAISIEDLLCHTHEFESHYVHELIGPPENTSLYQSRSPEIVCKTLKASPIFFHGLEDLVCPAKSTQAFVEGLKRSGLNPELHLYAGEGHGFRKGQTISDSLDKELAYYQRILKEAKNS